MKSVVHCYMSARHQPTCTSAETDVAQVLDRYLKKHSTSSGPFLLDDYSFAEAASAPFVFNTKLILSEFKKEDLLQLAKDAGADRLAEWMKVSCCRSHHCCPLHPLRVCKFAGDLASYARRFLFRCRSSPFL